MAEWRWLDCWLTMKQAVTKTSILDWDWTGDGLEMDWSISHSDTSDGLISDRY